MYCEERNGEEFASGSDITQLEKLRKTEIRKNTSQID